MNLVSETHIESIASQMGDTEGYQQIILRFKEQQPVLLAYLFSDNFKLLNQGEREYMIFLALVITESCYIVNPDLKLVHQNQIEDMEEKNWEILNSSSSRMFKERIDPFFENYTQEDLLAFVEDALVHDEDSEVTKEGREYVFVALKTIIDCFQSQ